MRFLLGVILLLFFTLVNAVYWGNSGYQITLFGSEVYEYGLIWVWIALIGVMFGSDFSLTGHSRNPVWLVISVWWAANIGVIDVLNRMNYRPLETSGDLFLGMPGVMLDFIAQSALDLVSLVVIWKLVRKRILGASIWLMGFCGFLLANLLVYSVGAYNIMTGGNPEAAGMFFDQYIYGAFTLLLIIQAVGSGGDALLARFGAGVDIYRDIRPVLRGFVNRNLHLF